MLLVDVRKCLYLTFYPHPDCYAGSSIKSSCQTGFDDLMTYSSGVTKYCFNFLLMNTLRIIRMVKGKTPVKDVILFVNMDNR